MIVGVVGAEPTETAKLPVDVPHVFTTDIPTVPDTAVAPQVVVILFVPWPAVIVTPIGTVHVYVAPVCAPTL